ncbi:DUF2971 domain-containing protein [Acinetobacter guillouiae]|uniref:DUF2971 domain-containing protein n=1 Tax=Acinetobacter guillouiae TaxID=106649 RepID=UPI003AF7B17C
MEFYRFRSLKNLFNQYDEFDKSQIKRYGELEEQTIFFPETHQLNDPMEGYRNLVWKGDEILWTNFIRNFMVFYSIIISKIDENKSIENIEYKKIKYQFFMEFRNFNAVKNKKTGEFYTNDQISNIKEEELNDLEFIPKIDLLNIPFLPLLEIVNFKKLIQLLVSNTIPNYKIELILGIILLNIHNFLFSPSSGYFEDDSLAEIDKIIKTDEYTPLKREERLLSIDQSNIGIDIYFKTINFYLKVINESMFDSWYVTCFMTKNDNPIVWSHYAENHQAICFIFKTIDESNKHYLNLRNNEKIVKKFELNKVEYDENKRNELNPFENFGMLMYDDLYNQWLIFNKKVSKIKERVYSDSFTNDYRANQFNDLLVKSNHWDYENEYRIILSDIMEFYKKPQMRSFQYDYNQLTGLIIGINTDQSILSKIVDVIRLLQIKFNRKDDFTIKQAYYCFEDKKIKSYDIITL